MRSLVIALSGAALILCANPLPAQPDPVPKDGKIVVPMTLHPAAAPRPASRAYLLPEFKDAIPGNRVQMFLRLFMEQDNFFGQKESERREKWRDMPLTDLPAKDVEDYGGRLLGRDAVDAARMLSVDWQIWPFIQRDGYKTLLPDVQKMRHIASTLQTRLRGAIRNGDHWMAIETARTLLGLAKTLEQHPTLIGQLVGIAVASLACHGLEELIQQPDCPNLFWAFTDLPTPFIDLRNGLQGERSLVTAQFKVFMEAGGPVTERELQAAIAEIDEIHRDYYNPRDYKNKPTPPLPSKVYAEWAKDEKRLEAARKRLIETGSDASAVKMMPPLQLVVTDDFRRYEIYRDEHMKWLNLSHWQARGAAEVEKEVKRLKNETILGYFLVPAVMKVKTAQTSLDQRIAYLRIIEAIRLHAHENGGKLPTTLDEIKLPLPVDPVTGKPFTYSVKDGVATVTGENPNPANEKTNRVYEIKLAK